MFSNEIAENQTDFGLLDVEVFGNVTEYQPDFVQSCCLVEVLAELRLHIAVQTQLQAISFLIPINLSRHCLTVLTCMHLSYICCVCHILVEKIENRRKLRATSENSQKLKKKQLEMSAESPLESCVKRIQNHVLKQSENLEYLAMRMDDPTWSIRHEGESLFSIFCSLIKLIEGLFKPVLMRKKPSVCLYSRAIRLHSRTSSTILLNSWTAKILRMHPNSSMLAHC